MTRRKQGQRTLWEGIVEEDVRALWEPWRVEADQLLDDQELIDQVFEAQGKRHEHSARKGRAQTPAEMVLRLLLLNQAETRIAALLVSRCGGHEAMGGAGSAGRHSHQYRQGAGSGPCLDLRNRRSCCGEHRKKTPIPHRGGYLGKTKS